jgi:signal transduction histidine kinase
MLDEASIRSTLINLMLNAVQAMAEGGQMTIFTSASEALLRLAISDTGCGMTEAQVSNVFEPFYTTKSQGLGIGMSFAAKVIQLHGGEIAVESRAGVGTSINIALPVEREKANAAVC